MIDADVPLGVVVAFGRIIKPPVLAAVPMVNLHFSLLPRWRGAAPVERAILAGDARTGVDLMAVEEGLDTGGIYERVEVPIGPDDTLEELRGRLVVAGSRILVDALGEGLGRAGAAGRRADLRRQARRPRTATSTGPRPAVDVHRRVRLGRCLDHARRPAAEGVAHPRAPGGRRPAGAGGRRAGRAGRGAARGQAPDGRGAPGPTAPAGPPATGSARERHRPGARARRPRSHRARRGLRQPPAARAPEPHAASRRATGTSPPSSSTAPRACVGPATSSSTASSPATSTSGSATRCASAPTSSTSWRWRRTPRWARRSRWRPRRPAGS